MNFLIRIIPNPIIKSVAKVDAKRLSMSRNISKKVSRWWYYSGEDFLEKLVYAVIGIVVIAIVIGVFWYITTSNNNKLLEVARQHTYQKGENAYCNHGQDDSNNPDAGWLPCNVLQKNNPQGTQYFVTYGTVQANISVDEMKQR